MTVEFVLTLSSYWAPRFRCLARGAAAAPWPAVHRLGHFGGKAQAAARKEFGVD